MISQRIISWVFLAATSITDPSSNNTFGTSELGLGEPKSAHPEGGFFGGDIWFEKTHGGFSKFFDLCMKIFRHYYQFNIIYVT